MKKGLNNLMVSKLILFMAIISILGNCLIGLVGYRNMKKINNNMTSMYEEELVPISDISSIRINFIYVRLWASKAQYNYQPEYDEKIKACSKIIDEKYKDYISTDSEPEELKYLNTYKINYTEYMKRWSKFNDEFKKGNKLSDNDLKELYALGEEIEKDLEAIEKFDLKLAQDDKNESDQIYYKSVKFLSFLALAILILIIAFSSTIIRTINNSIKNMIMILGRVSQGDFTGNIEVNGNNEFEIMKGSLRNTVKNISTMIHDVKEKCYNIENYSKSLNAISITMSSSAGNVSADIEDVAKGTGEQATDLVNIKWILNEFGNEIVNMVKLTKEIDCNSKEVHFMADRSNDDMQRLINSVDKVTNVFENLVSKTSNVGKNINRINEITSLINDIAEKTNLLALNAAIEASRGGESGKGFSVVAQEIRSLAEQSKDSLNNINMLISTISMDTDTMMKTTDVMKNELGNQKRDIHTVIQSFTNITNAVDEVSPKIETVSLSATNIDKEKNSILEKIEDASTIAKEVSLSSEQISSSAEEMIASTEDVSNASQMLSDMTKDMMDKVNRFKTLK